MIRLSNIDKLWFYGGSLVFAFCCFYGLWNSHPEWLIIPIALTGGAILLQKPVLLLYVLVASIPWSIEYSVTESLSTDLPDEPLMVLLSLAVIMLLVYKRKTLVAGRLNSILLLIVLLQLLWIMVSVLFSTNLVVSVKYLLAKGWYLGAFVLAPVVLIEQKEQLKRLALVFLVSLTAVVLISLARHAEMGFTFAFVNDSLYPFFRNHVNYSALLICGIPVTLGFLFQTKNKKYKQLLKVVLAILVIATFFAYARGAWVAIIMGGIAFWLLRKRILVASYILVVLIGIASVFYLKANDRYLVFAHDYETTIFHENFQEHLVATIKLKDVSSAERFNRWIGGIRMIKDYWVTGSGPNTFYPLYKQYTVPAFKTWVSRNEERSTVHNYFLLTIIEQGVIGFVLLMFLVGYMFYTAQRLYKTIVDPFWRTTIAVVTVILAMVLTVNLLSDLIEADKIGSMFYLCLAVLAIAEIRHKKVSNSSPDIHSIS